MSFSDISSSEIMFILIFYCHSVIYCHSERSEESADGNRTSDPPSMTYSIIYSAFVNVTRKNIPGYGAVGLSGPNIQS